MKIQKMLFVTQDNDKSCLKVSKILTKWATTSVTPKRVIRSFEQFPVKRVFDKYLKCNENLKPTPEYTYLWATLQLIFLMNHFPEF